MGGGQAKDMGGGQAKDMGGGQAEDMLLDMDRGQAKDMVLRTSQRHGAEDKPKTWAEDNRGV